MDKVYQINPADNVGVLLEARGDIPAGHKVALKDMKAGEKVIKYGLVIGRLTSDVRPGDHVHTHNMQTLLSETPVYHYNPKPAGSTTTASGPATFLGYKRPDGQVGTRNEIWIVPTVGCVNRSADALARWANTELCGDGRGIDGCYAWTHPYGCSQLGGDHDNTRAILADLCRHPNAGAVLVISLGCENNTPESFKALLGDYAKDTQRMAFLTTQDFPDEIAEGKRLLRTLAANAAKAKREECPASSLILGMKCGGSDGFSGITANALVGLVCDRHTSGGGTAILTEVPEMFGAEQLLMDRAASKEVYEQIVGLINGFKDYFTRHGQTVYENPSPGNRAGGITTLEDKSCGCVQKGGSATVTGVYKYGQRIDKKGLVLLEGPGNDIVSTTVQTAAGAQMLLFTTGRGTPLGAPAPTVKIASNSTLAQKKSGWIDFDAGRMLNCKDAPAKQALADELYRKILDIASGKIPTRNEINGYREIAIFKNGVTL
jgi:altronate hydrolase